MSDLEDTSRQMPPQRLLMDIARRFLRDSTTPLTVAPLGDGLINHTYRVDAPGAAFVLQRINGAVFPAPERIMDNLSALAAAAARHPELKVRLPALATSGNLAYVRDADGDVWRLMECIEPSRTLKRLAGTEQAAEVGRVLARFHRLGAGLDPATLAVTLPGFHHTPSYLAALDAAAAATEPDAESRDALAFIDARRGLVGVLDDALARGRTRLRLIHGDPKVDNLLFDAEGRHALCLIDLDTVQPGLLHHDIGDCLRSCCNRAGEAGAESVRFDLALCEALLVGYAETAPGLLSDAEIDLVAPAIRLIPLELGIRFLTDHLQGDRYFHVRHRGENLTKARRQLALVADIERQAAGIDAAVRRAFAPPPGHDAASQRWR
ncbi:MAG: aminoglycoside phosphotransferase family protein [Thiohalocapsa sp.]|uniref:phosphotransferase enzyme family protein n=1 Tax=Thiohalocapsa sp. TaxID=2497641 RepID=UPI0025FCCEAE|nr:phosphotransferase [Thiohalocapsa sp.]MCG6939907.1 aminoglycoside phosphotransferase family protein [Thiohalocapsa sp.]